MTPVRVADTGSIRADRITVLFLLNWINSVIIESLFRLSRQSGHGSTGCDESLRAGCRAGEFYPLRRADGHPQGDLSAAIRRLEERMGTRLLLRTTRRVQLTTDGQLCYARCRELLADMEEFDGLFRQGQISGQLRVDMPSRMARHLVIPALPDFLAQHPALQLMLSSTDRQVDLVREGFDCVVRVGALEPSSLVARPLVTIARSTVPAQATWLARVPRTLGIWRATGWCTMVPGLVPGRGRSEPGFEYLAEDGCRALLPMAGPSWSMTARPPGGGAGGAWHHPDAAGGVESPARGGELVSILPQWQPPPLPIHALYAHRRQLAPGSSSSSTGWRGCSPPISGGHLRGGCALSETRGGEGKRLPKEAGKKLLWRAKPRRSPLSAGEGGILQQAAGLLPRTRSSRPRSGTLPPADGG